MNTTSRKPDSVSRVNITPLLADVGAHHLHHADRQADLEMIEAVVDAVDDAAIGEQRGEAAAAGLEQIVVAADVKVALMLAGEAGGGQVFRGGRTAHRDSHAGAGFAFQGAVGLVDGARSRAVLVAS